MLVRPMERSDVGVVIAIQSASPEVAQWTAADYDLTRRAGTSGWIAEDGQRIVGFLVVRQIMDEVEILNFAVCRDFRRRGMGSELLSKALKHAFHQGAVKAYLDVRASNHPAIELYKRHGFTVIGRRADYYAAPSDDALVLVLQLKDNLIGASEHKTSYWRAL